MFRDKVVPHILGLDEIETLLNKRLDDQEKQVLPAICEKLKQKTLQVNVSEKQRMN